MKGNRKQHLRDNTRSGDAFEQSVRLFGNLEFDRRETEGRLQFALVLLRTPTVSMYTSVTFTFMRSNSRIMSIAALCDISFKLKGFVWSMFAEISFGDSVRIT